MAATVEPPTEIISIPDGLLSHDTLDNHPKVKELHQSHGGIPPNQEHIQHALDFANEVARSTVEPGTMKRVDPSPRRDARVFRGQLLGHVDASPERPRYRSRTRQPSFTGSNRPDTVKEEATSDAGSAYGHEAMEDTKYADHRPETGPGARPLGRREGGGGDDTQFTAFSERVLHRMAGDRAQTRRDMEAFEMRIEAIEARTMNKVNAYLNMPLVPVSNGKTQIPRELPPLDSLKSFSELKPGQVVSWIEYYTGNLPKLHWYEDEKGHRSQQVDEQTLNALRACVGVEDIAT